MKQCNAKNAKANNDKYKCNRVTGRWNLKKPTTKAEINNEFMEEFHNYNYSRMKKFIKLGANLDDALHISIENRDDKQILFLLKHGANLDYALSVAILTNNLKIVKKAVRKGASVNAKYRDGSSHLMRAVDMGTNILYNISKNYKPIIEFLLKNGANRDINRIDIYGYNAFSLAVMNRQPMSVIKMLLEAGADYDLRDEYNRTAVQKLRKSVYKTNLIKLISFYKELNLAKARDMIKQIKKLPHGFDIVISEYL